MSPSRQMHVEISVTEGAQYRRLVEFLEEVENTARVNADDELQGLVDTVREDLRKLGRS